MNLNFNHNFNQTPIFSNQPQLKILFIKQLFSNHNHNSYRNTKNSLNKCSKTNARGRSRVPALLEATETMAKLWLERWWWLSSAVYLLLLSLLLLCPPSAGFILTDFWVVLFLQERRQWFFLWFSLLFSVFWVVLHWFSFFFLAGTKTMARLICDSPLPFSPSLCIYIFWVYALFLFCDLLCFWVFCLGLASVLPLPIFIFHPSVLGLFVPLCFLGFTWVFFVLCSGFFFPFYRDPAACL